MVKKFVVCLVFSLAAAGGVQAADFGKINSALGPNSFATGIYGGAVLNNFGANYEWGIGELPLTLGIGFSPLLSGEYAFRAGYHPDLGVKGLDVYLNLTAGIMNIFFIPLPAPQFGIHIGARYFFGSIFGIFGEGGWALNANYVKMGIAFKRGSKG
jgi:hypothetical protein